MFCLCRNMSLKTDIYKTVLHRLSEDRNKLNGDPRINEATVENLSTKVINSCLNKTYDFSKLSTYCLTQKKYLKNSKKKRIIKRYEGFDEDILSTCVKKILDKTFQLRFPNRNKICKTLFAALPAILQMSDFTIVKFDFKNFFNSVNSLYVFEKFIRKQILQRDELDLVEQYVNSTKFAFAGLRPSNSIAEIIARAFDEILTTSLSKYGLIYYERYIDDAFLILNSYLSKSEVENLLTLAINHTFYDTNFLGKLGIKNYVHLNKNKFEYISSRDNKTSTINFLGYSFKFSVSADNAKIIYGISEEKRLKYLDRLKKIISLCCIDKTNDDYGDYGLLEHRIRCFTTRQVYVTRHLKFYTWKSKGLISNYGELRYLIDSRLLDPDTKSFLKNVLYKGFKELGVNPPHFLKQYDLFENMKKNRTLLFVRRIGYNHASLAKLCKQVGIHSKGYEGLVRDYLIKMKVGY